jgi:hypothetical protein
VKRSSGELEFQMGVDRQEQMAAGDMHEFKCDQAIAASTNSTFGKGIWVSSVGHIPFEGNFAGKQSIQ